MAPKGQKGEQGELSFKAFEKAARAQGWTIDKTKSGHPRFTPPDKSKPACIYSGTPGGNVRRGLLNFLSDLKRSGLRWP